MCEAYDEAAAGAGFLAGLSPLVRAAASGDVEASRRSWRRVSLHETGRTTATTTDREANDDAIHRR